MIRNIVDAKNPILRRNAKPVIKIDRKIEVIARDLVDTLKCQKDPEGVGLAAPQIGKSLRLFAMVWKGGFRVIINPEIISVEKSGSSKNPKKKNKNILEGCLSIPNYYGPLKRPSRIKIRFWDTDGKTQTEEFTGFPAQIVQHEIDHLNGKLFTDEIIKQKKPLYKLDPKSDDWEEVDIV